MSGCDWRTLTSKETLLERALMLKNIRTFFDDRGVIEVETPLLSQYSTTDPHLDSLQSSFRDQTCYLNTSPEYAMKRLLAEWVQPIFQVCKAFRDDELGPNHNPEFTLLEWYRPDYNCNDLMGELTELVTCLCLLSSKPELKAAKFERWSYQQAFENHAGINPHSTTPVECYECTRDHGIEVPQGLDMACDVNDWLDWLLTQQVLPAFKKDCFTFLFDYPVAQCALAKITKNEQNVPVASRFELFFGEIELANGFHELTDGNEQLRRFKLENIERKRAGKQCASIDENFIAALRSGIPACAGVAVGLDRFLMVIANALCIEQVISYPWGKA